MTHLYQLNKTHGQNDEVVSVILGGKLTPQVPQNTSSVYKFRHEG